MLHEEVRIPFIINRMDVRLRKLGRTPTKLFIQIVFDSQKFIDRFAFSTISLAIDAWLKVGRAVCCVLCSEPQFKMLGDIPAFADFADRREVFPQRACYFDAHKQ